MAPSVTTLDLTPALRPERAALLALLRDLSADDWKRSTECPAWSTKDIALHILGDDLSLLSRQRDAATNGLMLFAVDHPGTSFRGLLDGFNEQWVTASRFLSTELVIELLGLVGDWSATFYCDVGLATVSPEPVGLFAATEPSPYWQVIAREYLERFVHQSQIRRAVGAEELEGQLVTSVASVVVHVLSAWMREYAPATGSTVADRLRRPRHLDVGARSRSLVGARRERTSNRGRADHSRARRDRRAAFSRGLARRGRWLADG